MVCNLPKPETESERNRRLLEKEFQELDERPNLSEREVMRWLTLKYDRHDSFLVPYQVEENSPYAG